MNISQIVYSILNEEVQNKKLFDFLLTKWGAENPNAVQERDKWDEEVEKIYNDFKQIQPALTNKKLEVRNFLYRYDGSHGYEKFDEKFLKDITKYTYDQITDLIGEFKPDADVDQNVGVFELPKSEWETKVKASKNLWEGKKYQVLDIGNIRVYHIPNQLVSQMFGYYQEYFKRQNGSSGTWCIAAREGQTGTNMWSNYRNNGGTFYFLIDDTRPLSDRWHISAIQKKTSIHGFFVTCGLNMYNADKVWEDVVQIYPELEGHEDVFKAVPFSRDEVHTKNIVGLITEDPTDKYEFRRVSRRLKAEYISAHGLLHKVESWHTMDKNLRHLYLRTIEVNNAKQKISNWPLLNEIRKTKYELITLDKRLRELELPGVAYIVEGLFEKEYRTARGSLDNAHIRLFEKVADRGTYGIYDAAKVDWKDHNGIKYAAEYKEIDTDGFMFGDTAYIVETYSITPQPSNTTFYCLYPVEMDGNDNSTDAHFISHNKWVELTEKYGIDLDGNSDDLDFSGFNPETDVDIKEALTRFGSLIK